jgi:hypothetical protein
MSKTAENQPPDLLFQALGCVRGRLQYTEKGHPILVVEEFELPVMAIAERCRKWLETQPKVVEGFWTIYPHLFQGQLLSVSLQAFRRTDERKDEFIIAGRVCVQKEEEGTVLVKVKRNLPTPPGKEDHPAWKPSYYQINGFLPGNVGGEFWRLNCVRRGRAIEIVDGVFVAPPQKPKSANKKRRRKPQEQASKKDVA